LTLSLKPTVVCADLRPVRPSRGWSLRREHLWAAAVLALLSACSTPPPLKQVRPVPLPALPEPAPEPVVQFKPVPPPPPAPEPPLVTPALRHATAASARDYRQYGAHHIYAQNEGRVFKGRMPPMLYAVGVLNVDIDSLGQVQRLDWARAPKHAPEVMADIERMVRAAAPFPAPTRMGRVTWTDVWLWDKSGRFQLDTLTEGQRSR
jgi:protein TonB